MKVNKGLGLIVVFIFLSAESCNNTPGKLVDNEFQDFLENNGYHPLAIPSKLERGGSLVYVKEKKDGTKTIEWVDSLQGCGMSESIVFGESESERELNKNATFPQFSIGNKSNFDIGLSASLPGVSGKVGASAGLTSRVSVAESGKETIKRLAVAYYLADPLARENLKPYCVEAIESQKVAVLVDVAYIDKGTVEFFNDAGFEVGASKDEIIKALELSGKASATVSKNGTMQINERIYVAFKDSFFVPDAGTLSGPSPQLESADRALMQVSGLK